MPTVQPTDRRSTAVGLAVGLAVALLLSSLLGVGGSSPVQAVTTVWINEIHYDNSGTDTGEAVEMAGPAGTDLTGWQIVLYDGDGGAPYTTTPLSGSLADQLNGFGTTFVSYPTNGIGNGDPDALALVDPGSTVIQFLSYEGTFTAVGGSRLGHGRRGRRHSRRHVHRRAECPERGRRPGDLRPGRQRPASPLDR